MADEWNAYSDLSRRSEQLSYIKFSIQTTVIFLRFIKVLKDFLILLLQQRDVSMTSAVNKDLTRSN